LSEPTDPERDTLDLHDTVVQRLFKVGLDLEVALHLLPASEARERIEAAISGTDETIRQIRSATLPS
jgi:signal transduction histidine kinase